nr:reverse transcriptase domain-containing protein [Tanacetum cinerariifolium]
MQNQINNVKNELKSDINELRNMMASYFQKDTASTSGLDSPPNNTIANLWSDLKGITTRNGVSYDAPPIPLPFSSLPKVVERVPEVTKDTVQLSTKNIQPLVAQTQVLIDELVVTPRPKPTIPYPSRVTKQKLREKDDNLALKFVEIFRNLHFNLTFADALLHMPKFALMFKSLLNNKEKLFDLAPIPMNENCSAVILKKLPEKLRDPGRFLISCDFLKLDECLALVDLGESINLMPLSIWRKLYLSKLTPTQMILELAKPFDDLTSRLSQRRFCKSRKVPFPTDFITDTSIRAMQNQIANFKTELKNEINSSMQNQINNVKNELKSDINELRNMMASYFQKDTASTSGSDSLPNNTIANPRSDLKGITTRNGVSYDAPPIPLPFSSLPKVVERVPEVTKDTVQLSTKNIQPLVAQTQVLIDELVVTPRPKPTIPYPSRVTKQKLREKDDNLALKFVEIFRNLHFNLTFADALLHMP